MIVTADFADFVHYRAVVPQPDRVAVIPHPGGRIIVAHPAAFAACVRGGEMPAEVRAGGA